MSQVTGSRGGHIKRYRNAYIALALSIGLVLLGSSPVQAMMEEPTADLAGEDRVMDEPVDPLVTERAAATNHEANSSATDARMSAGVTAANDATTSAADQAEAFATAKVAAGDMPTQPIDNAASSGPPRASPGLELASAGQIQDVDSASASPVLARAQAATAFPNTDRPQQAIRATVSEEPPNKNDGSSNPDVALVLTTTRNVNDLVTNFSPARGDLIYGLGEKRTAGLREIPSIQNEPRMYSGDMMTFATPQVIDSVNNVRIALAHGLETDDYFESIKAKYLEWFGSSQYSEGQMKLIDSIKLLNEIEINKNLYKYGGQDFSDDSPPFTDSICRGCKEGIRSAFVEGANHQIHFELSGIDNMAVATKYRGNIAYFRPNFTSSELRQTYRVKDHPQFNEKIHFYKDGNKTAAPWVSDVGAWSQYHPRMPRKN